MILNRHQVDCFSRDDVDLHLIPRAVHQYIYPQRKVPGRMHLHSRANWPTLESDSSFWPH